MASRKPEIPVSKVLGVAPFNYPTPKRWCSYYQQVMASREVMQGVSSTPLAHLEQETELHKMLADEQMRSEKHKTNYQTLKAQYTRLQDDNVSLQNELRSTVEECRLVQEKYSKLLEQARLELVSKITEIEQLRTQVMNPKMVESMKMQAQGELEKSFREQFSLLDRELEKFRSENKKLKYDYNFLKSEFEHNRQEHLRIIEEMTMRNDVEVASLRREREAMIASQQQDSSADAQHWRAVQKENVQLNLKAKSLLAELDELRSQREHAGMQADSVTRLQVKQLAEHSATIKALETEKQSLRSQCDTLHREITACNDENSRLIGRVHELEKDVAGLRNKIEETMHRSKLDVTNIRVEMLRERGEIERERDRLAGQLRDALDEMDVLKQTVASLQSSVVEKEKELMRKVQAAREEEWQKMNKLESEKLELESRVHELDKRRIDVESSCRQSIDKAEERVRGALDLKDAAEREALVSRTKLENQLQLLDSLERERAESAELRARLQRIDTQYNAYVGGECELIALNERLEREAKELRVEVERFRDSTTRDREMNDNALVQHRAAWLEEKCNLQRRIDDLDGQLASATNQLSVVTSTYKQKKSRMKHLVTKLRDRVSHLQLTNDQLQVDKEALKRSIPLEAHEQLKKRLFDLLQRNREFRALLLASNFKQTQTGGINFGTVTSSNGPDIFSSLSSFFEVNQKDLSHLKERLDMLDNQQRHQLEELRRTTSAPHGGPRVDASIERNHPPTPRSTADSTRDDSDAI